MIKVTETSAAPAKSQPLNDHGYLCGHHKPNRFLAQRRFTADQSPSTIGVSVFPRFFNGQTCRRVRLVNERKQFIGNNKERTPKYRGEDEELYLYRRIEPKQPSAQQRYETPAACRPRRQVKSLVFDQSGTYLAVGGSDIRVYICKQWSEVLNFTDHTGLVTGVAFGENAQFLTSAGMDRSLKFYSL
ncbi:pre-mRNA-processing factor 19 [Lates japonicus]|uniref:Pre-mRNA-processing factor 19 n=1 Tax=Lates japonicus TaxID=270547 RepID=A0AAD3R3H6_LATJO|nr:pre-mRNA-processing factor 19 [Lates japonicus]